MSWDGSESIQIGARKVIVLKRKRVVSWERDLKERGKVAYINWEAIFMEIT